MCLRQPGLSGTRPGQSEAQSSCVSIYFQLHQDKESVSNTGMLNRNDISSQGERRLDYAEREAGGSKCLRSFQIMWVVDSSAVYPKCLCPESTGLHALHVHSDNPT